MRIFFTVLVFVLGTITLNYAGNPYVVYSPCAGTPLITPGDVFASRCLGG